MRKVYNLFTLEHVFMVTPDQMSYYFSETCIKPCSEAETCSQVRSEVDMVVSNAATISTTKH